MRRYRVHYNACFDVDIDAVDMAEAKAKAGMLDAMPLFVAAHKAIETRFGWNYIEPMTSDDDD